MQTFEAASASSIASPPLRQVDSIRRGRAWMPAAAAERHAGLGLSVDEVHNSFGNGRGRQAETHARACQRAKEADIR